MKFSSLSVIIFASLSSFHVRALTGNGLRGSPEEDAQWYGRMVQEISSMSITPGPTPSPSAPPTGGPTPSPSTPPTAGPTPSPSTPPTAGPTPSPSTPPTAGPTPSPSTPPTAGPTPSPSSPPTAGPTPSPSSPPTAGPTPSPSSPPTAGPTPAPSSPPTAGPTPSPTTSPPSLAPSTSSPTPINDCGIELNIEPNCPDLPCGWNFCEERPFRMEFIYRGGTCSETEIRRCGVRDPDLCTCVKELVPREGWRENKVTCDDFNAGPPELAAVDTIVYIQAVRKGGDSDYYFEGPVRVGNLFEARTTEDRVSADMDLFVYECMNCTETSGMPGELLQHVVFHSSCSQELYLGDIFGGFQLLEFESDSQLVGTFFQENPIEFDVSLDLQAIGDTLVLSTAQIIMANQGELVPTQFIDFDVAGQVIPPPLNVGGNFTVIPDRNFTVLGTIQGSIDGLKCESRFSSTFLCPSPNP